MFPCKGKLVTALAQHYPTLTVISCARNVAALFHILEKEIAWRRSHGKAIGFNSLLASKPLVALGAEHPLEERELAADHFRKSPPQNTVASV